MAEILLVKQEPTEISEADRAVVRRVLFGIVDGLGEKHKKSWRRMWNWMFKAEPGEMLELKTHRERIGVNHRKHMAMEQAVFEAQERFDNFDAFRSWLKVGAGFVDWFPGPKGGVIPVPRSISYAKLEEDEMATVHDDIVAFLRTDHACKTLWKHLSVTQRIEQIEFILTGFHE